MTQSCVFCLLPISVEELLKEERTCRQEITAYEKKIENWSLVVRPEPRLPTAATDKVSLSPSPSFRCRLIDVVFGLIHHFVFSRRPNLPTETCLQRSEH